MKPEVLFLVPIADRRKRGVLPKEESCVDVMMRKILRVPVNSSQTGRCAAEKNGSEKGPEVSVLASSKWTA